MELPAANECFCCAGSASLNAPRRSALSVNEFQQDFVVREMPPLIESFQWAPDVALRLPLRVSSAVAPTPINASADGSGTPMTRSPFRTPSPPLRTCQFNVRSLSKL